MMKIPERMIDVIQLFGGRVRLSDLTGLSLNEISKNKIVSDEIKEKIIEGMEKLQPSINEEGNLYDVPTYKSEAIRLFGGTTAMADAVGVTKQSITSWRERLTKNAQDRIELAMMKEGMLKPKD